jgi:DNA-binding response OmpR family regulator
MRLLVVEDDRALGAVIQRGLIDEGHAVDWERTIAGADEAVAIHRHALIVLDLGLPDGDGASWCARQRRDGNTTPVLMLTARDTLSDRVGGLDAGADDYLTKPFQFPELAARVRALLRRPQSGRSPVLTVGDVRLDPATHTVWRGGIAIALTAREFSLLHVLMDRSGEVVTRTDLLEQVWDAHYDGLSNVVDVHVANVRRKLEIDGLPSVIDTVRGVGYKMQP